MNKKKNISFFIAVAILLVFFSVPKFTGANIFDDMYAYVKNIFSSPSSTVSVFEENQVSLYKPVIEYEESVISAVEQASPMVVSIVVTKDLPVIEECPYNPFSDVPGFETFFGDGFMFSVPCENNGDVREQEIGGGSGFIVSEDGLVVTNKHVVLDGDAEYTVLTNDGEKYSAKVLARDPIRDLAVLKIEATELPFAKLGNSDSVKLGQTAIAIGNALGEFRNTVSVGVISGLSRTITASGGLGFTEKIEGVIQTDAAINQGNSGGPILNLRGEVIGINTAIASGAQNIGFAIPINQVKRAIQSVKDTGSIKTTYLGVRYTMVTKKIAEDQELPAEYGALIRGSETGPAILPGSPAERAGIEAEDIILKINGEELSEELSLVSAIQKYGPGETVSLTIQRGEELLELRVTLEERPEEK